MKSWANSITIPRGTFYCNFSIIHLTELQDKYLEEAKQIRQKQFDKDIEEQLLQGDFDVELPEKRKVVRLFTSSTFTGTDFFIVCFYLHFFIFRKYADTKLERDYLMKEVYPFLKMLCDTLKYQFEIVDMRVSYFLLTILLLFSVITICSGEFVTKPQTIMKLQICACPSYSNVLSILLVLLLSLFLATNMGILFNRFFRTLSFVLVF